MSEKEIRQAEQERYDLETLARYRELAIRFGVFEGMLLGNPFEIALLHQAAMQRLPFLIEKATS